MTKKDFVAIATAIDVARAEAITIEEKQAVQRCARLIAAACLTNNISFDNRRFMAACGF